jgi:hypothetical protein
MLRTRSAANSLKAVQEVDGTLVTSLPNILRVAFEFYRAHLNADSVTQSSGAADRRYILEQIPSKIGSVQSLQLDAPISKAEVCFAI